MATTISWVKAEKCSAAERLRDRSGKPAEASVCEACGGFAAYSPNYVEI